MKLALPIFFLLKTCLVFAQSPLLDSLKMAAETAARNNDRNAEAEALRELAWEQANAGSSFEALENAERAKSLFEALGKPLEAQKTTAVQVIVHQQMHNGEKILEHALPALDFARSIGDSLFIARSLMSVGIGFDEKKEYEKAAAQYLEEIEIEKAIGAPTHVSHLNASSSLTSVGRFSEALRHAELCIEQSQMMGDTVVLIYGQLAKAYALLKNGQAAAAAESVLLAENLALDAPEVNLTRDLFLTKSMVAAARGDFRGAYLLHTKFYELDSTFSSSQRNAQFAELETIYQTKKKEAENARLTTDLSRQKMWIWGILGAAFFLGIIVWMQRNRLKINAKLVEAERRLLAEEKAFHQSALDNLAGSLREKNSVIESLKTELDHQIQRANQPDDRAEKAQLLDQLTQATILTDEQWRNFRQKFERVHAGFFQKFGATVADATEAELRLAALTKLEMTNSEIAAMLGISPDSVVKTRYRLRKKLGSEDLDAVVQTL